MNKTEVEIIGIYPADAQEPVHLIELIVQDSEEIFDIYQFTQEVRGEPEGNWQVPYDEKFLDRQGQDVIADYFQAKGMPEIWQGVVRLAFFFHYLDPKQKFRTPFGEISLPEESSIPSRLSQLVYMPPG